MRLYALRRWFEFPITLNYLEMLDLSEGSGERLGELMGHTPVSFGVAVRGGSTAARLLSALFDVRSHANQQRYKIFEPVE